MTVDQAISLARAELGMPPVMEATERKLALVAASRVMADFYREFEPIAERYTIQVEDREAVIPKNIEISTLFHGGVNITSHRVRAEEIPTKE